MRPICRFFCVAAALTALLGGCPVTTDTGTGISTPNGSGNAQIDVSTPSGGGSGTTTTDTTPSGGSGSTTTTGSTSSGTAGTTAGPGVSFETQLVQDFPTCLEAVQGDDWRDEVLRLVNIERERVGLNAVTQNQTLEDQATQYACEMIHYDFFAHENPVTGTTLADRADEFGYDYRIIGENLAAGQPTPARAVSDWMDSPGHRENILNPEFTELGVGVRTGGEYGTYWVQEFGRPF